MNHLVSIILPVYNQESFLPLALESIFSQTYKNIELIVVNDGSTDRTSDVLEYYHQVHKFTVINQANQGLPKALNTGFDIAVGDYLTWTSSDNKLLPEMISGLAHALDENPDVGLVYADRYIIDQEGNMLGRFDTPEYDRHLLLHLNLINCCFLYRVECARNAGQYDPNFIYSEDWEYWIRLSMQCKMMRIPQVYYEYRIHPRSMTGEIMDGSAKNIGYTEFAARIRKRYPIDWWWGKIKYLAIKYLQHEHPIVSERKRWKDLLDRYASQEARTC